MLEKKLFVCLDDGFYAVEKIQDAGNLEPVVDLFAASVADDDPGFFEYGQVFGHGRHVMADECLQVAHAVFAMGECIYHLQPRRVGHSFHDIGSLFDLRGCDDFMLLINTVHTFGNMTKCWCCQVEKKDFLRLARDVCHYLVDAVKVVPLV